MYDEALKFSSHVIVDYLVKNVSESIASKTLEKEIIVDFINIILY